jgi:stage II sporulation protein GA (sporulation sigma-E factor processing peptidase)
MNWKELIRLSIILFLVTCFAGGFFNSVLLSYQAASHSDQLDASVIFSNIPMGYILLTFIGIILLTVLLVWLRKRYHGSKKDIYEIELICGAMSTKSKGLVDTGNCLFDPISRKPVIIVEKQVMEQIIPSECVSLLQINEIGMIQKEAAAGQELWDRYRFRLILIGPLERNRGFYRESSWTEYSFGWERKPTVRKR